jgi:hydroxypyruvate reductase
LTRAAPPSARRFRELAEIFRHALAAVDSGELVRCALRWVGDALEIAGDPVAPAERLLVLAAGKAAAAMAGGVEAVAGERIARGLAVTRDGCEAALVRVTLRSAGHPVPDTRSEACAQEVLDFVEAAAPGDRLLVLLSGGASSLLACPAQGLLLEDLAAATRLLLVAGADIEELNAVRKHLSALSGGRLARRARPDRIDVLALSDVPGDRVDVIGSGPFAADPSTYAEALAVLRHRGVLGRLPERVRTHLEAGLRGERAETPKPGDPDLARVRHVLLATNRTAVAAAASAAERAGLRSVALGSALHGEAREAAASLVASARAARAGDPVCLVAGGETTVAVRGRGLGGRCQELALAAALHLDGGPPTALLAAGTDGNDGPTPAAGAYADEQTLARARRAGLDARIALAANDAHPFFRAEGGLFATGPTRTNVMDLALLRVDPGGAVR